MTRRRKNRPILLDHTAQGVYAIAVTPFKPDGSVDVESVDSMTDFYVGCVIRFQRRGVNTLLSGIWLLFFVMWIVLMVKAYRGQRFKLPIVGDLAARWAGCQLE